MLVTLVTIVTYKDLEFYAWKNHPNNLSNYGKVGNLSDMTLKIYYDILKICQ